MQNYLPINFQKKPQSYENILCFLKIDYKEYSL